MIRQIVVLAGGLATRMRPITEKIPKSMIEVAGEPFFSHQLRQFKNNGIEEVVMCVGHLAEQIMDYYGDGKEFGLKIIYSREDEKKDTGGAIKLALPHLDDVFFTIYGDSYLRQEYAPVVEFYEAHPEARGLMTVYENNNQIEPSRILVDGEYVELYRKDPPPPGARFMEYGLNILQKSVVEEIPGDVFPFSEFLDLLAPKKQLLAFPVLERFYEIGSFSGLEDTERLLAEDASKAEASK